MWKLVTDDPELRGRQQIEVDGRGGIDRTSADVRFPKPNLRNQISLAKGGPAVGRPPAKDLTERELEVMHVFWRHGELTAAQARDHLAASGLDRTYTTIANLVRALYDKGFLKQVNDERPFLYRPARSYEDVSGRLLGDLVQRVFRGSRTQLLCRLVERRKLTAEERAALERILKEHGQ
jgi:BlaI family transcriptional regulator, penicillinase repressor